jgi:oligopeptide transport system permease protein
MSDMHNPEAPIPSIPKEKFRFVKRGEIKDERFQTKAIGFFEDAMIRLKKNKASVASAWMIAIIVALAILVPEISQHGFNDQNVGRVNLPPRIPVIEKLGIADGSRLLINRRESELADKTKYPDGTIIRIENARSLEGVKMVDVLIDSYQLAGVKDEYHWFGTDYLGRDLMTRLFRGSRISLTIAFVSVASNVLIGIVYGAIAGYYGGSVDMVLMRFVEIMRSLPQLVMVTMFIMLFGTGMTSIILALVIRGWTPTASLIRAQFYRFKGREYVLAARTMGVPDYQLIFRHILPNCIGPVITQSMIAIPGAIFSESFLAFIGLGLQPPESSIGVLLSNGQKTLLQYPYQTLFPAVLISILMISFNLFANGLRDAFDPTKRGEE